MSSNEASGVSEANDANAEAPAGVSNAVRRDGNMNDLENEEEAAAAAQRMIRIRILESALAEQQRMHDYNIAAVIANVESALDNRVQQFLREIRQRANEDDRQGDDDANEEDEEEEEEPEIADLEIGQDLRVWPARVNVDYLADIRLLERGSNGASRISIRGGVLADLFLNPELQERFLQALSQHSPPLECVDLDWGDVQLMATDLAGINMEIVSAALASSAMKIGETLDTISSLTKLVSISNDAASISAVAALIAKCRSHLQTAMIDVSSEASAEQLAALKTSLINHPTLKRFWLSNFRKDAFRILGPVATSLAQLEACHLRARATPTSPPLVIDSPQSAIILRNIIEAQSLKSLFLDNFDFRTQRVAEIVGSAWARSSVKSLTIPRSSFSGGAEAIFGSALAEAKLAALDIAHSAANCCHLLDVFAVGLKHAKTIDVVTVGEEEEDDGFLNSDSLVNFLREGPNWKVQNLFLHIRDWTKSFDDALSYYVSHSDSLKKVHIIVPHEFSGPMNATQSKGIMSAIDSGHRCLEHFRVVQAGCHHLVWGEELKPILRLNRMRRIYGYLLERVARAATAEERHRERTVALETMGMDVLNEFLLRDEWNLQDLAKQYALDNCGHV